MNVCKNENCSRSYKSPEGQALLDQLHTLAHAHQEGRVPDPRTVDALKPLAFVVYQPGDECEQCHQPLATQIVPDQHREPLNELLSAVTWLHDWGVLPAG